MTFCPALFDGAAADTILLVRSSEFAAWLAEQSPTIERWLNNLGVDGKPGAVQLLPDPEGPRRVLVTVGDALSTWSIAHLPCTLPAGDYQIQGALSSVELTQLATGFALGAYQFDRYKKSSRSPARLAVDAPTCAAIGAIAEAVHGARDWVNTPTEDMGPAHLGAATAELALCFGARFREVVGEELLTQNFPAIHAVGRASHRPPRLLELNWGDDNHPSVCLVGKGVCFDTGGLNMKSGAGMALMKKDMGGSAVAFGLARLIMATGLKVRLRLLISAVENAIGPDAFRPGEVIATRAGHSVEITNTDAEGRLVLCDALTYATESTPDLLMDFATLTGAARIALGPDLPATFSNDDALAQALISAGRGVDDTLWAMPLFTEYQRYLDSGIADFCNSSSTSMGGAITAALFLQRFVPDSQPWIHMDTYCWADSDRPGRPKGGDCQGLRAAFAYLSARFG